VHIFDALRWLVGDEAVRLYGSAGSVRAESWRAASAMVQVDFSQGASAQVWTSEEIPAPGFPNSGYQMRIFGEKGIMECEGYTKLQLAHPNKWEVVWEQPPLDPVQKPLDPARLEPFFSRPRTSSTAYAWAAPSGLRRRWPSRRGNGAGGLPFYPHRCRGASSPSSLPRRVSVRWRNRTAGDDSLMTREQATRDSVRTHEGGMNTLGKVCHSLWRLRCGAAGGEYPGGDPRGAHLGARRPGVSGDVCVGGLTLFAWSFGLMALILPPWDSTFCVLTKRSGPCSRLFPWRWRPPALWAQARLLWFPTLQLPGSTWEMVAGLGFLRALGAPLLALGFFTGAALAPARRSRWALLVAGGFECAATAYVNYSSLGGTYALSPLAMIRVGT